MKRFVLLLAVIFPVIAYADSYVLGAAYQCNKKAQKFTIAATADSSNEENEIQKESGFTEFRDGKSRVSCALGDLKLQANVDVRPPSDRGKCAGIGNVKVVINAAGYSSPIFEDGLFGNFCFLSGERETVKVEVNVRNRLKTLTVCTASDSEGDYFIDIQCETRPLPR